MSTSVDFYEQQAQTVASNISWLLELQKKAIGDFKQMGFPLRTDEDWKYARLEPFLEHAFSVQEPMRHEKMQSALYQQALSEATFFDISNGIVTDASASAQKNLPEGLVVQPLAQAIVDHPKQIQTYLNHILPQEHAFQLLNTAMLQQGYFVYVPPHTEVSLPLLLSHGHQQQEGAAYLRHLIVLDTGARLTMVEEFHGAADCCYFTNTMTEIYLAKHAALTHFKVQCEGSHAYHVGHTAVKQAEHSCFESHVFSMGGKWARSDISIDLSEPFAECLMNGVYSPDDSQHMEHHTLVQHNAPNCHSDEDYKGILKDCAHGVFHGRVLVAKGAILTQAKQQNKNLLLSREAEIDTKPQLEIFADDVLCSHGATVGQLDEEAIFYLATRGIDRSLAVAFLLRAFIEVNLQKITLPSIKDWLGSLL